jgi:hypothetical protein
MNDYYGGAQGMNLVCGDTGPPLAKKSFVEGYAEKREEEGVSRGT